MFIEFSDNDTMYIDNRTQAQINFVLSEKLSLGKTIELTDIPDWLFTDDGNFIQYWDEFVKLSKDYEGRYENEALFMCIKQFESLCDFERLYFGRFDSDAKCAQEFISRNYDIPEFINPFVDYRRLFDELNLVEVEGYYFEY